MRLCADIPPVFTRIARAKVIGLLDGVVRLE
jgi:hypothetical protein